MRISALELFSKLVCLLPLSAEIHVLNILRVFKAQQLIFLRFQKFPRIFLGENFYFLNFFYPRNFLEKL